MFPCATDLTSLELKSAIVREPLIVSPDTTVMAAIAQMSGVRSHCHSQKMPDAQLDDLHLEARSSCVLVVEDGQVVGIFTERDVVQLTAQQQPLDRLVMRQVINHSVVTLRESAFTNIFSAINLLQQHQIRHLPILDEQERLVGLVTHKSLRYIARSINLLRLRQVAEVMTHAVIYAAPDCDLLAIAQRMADYRISSIVIVEPGGAEAVGAANSPDAASSPPTGFDGSPTEPLQMPVGILTERDLVQFQALGLNLKTCKAQAVMSTPVFAVKPDESLWTVQQIMEQRFIHRLVVTGEQGELLGIVTQTSLLQAFNPLELYKLAEVLEEKVVNLEAEKVALLESRTIELEQQVEARTASLQAKAEREKLVMALAMQIRSSLSLQKILQTTVNQVRQVLGCDRVNIWRFEADGQAIVVAESTDSPLSLVGERIDDRYFKQDYSEIYRQGRMSIVPDIYTKEMSDCHREMLKSLQTRAKILVPLLCGDQLWGMLNATESQYPRDWQAEDVELLQVLSVQLAIALQQAITHQQLQEELIARQQAEARLRESEQRYATLVAAAPVGIFRTDATGNCVYVNDHWCQISGLTPETATGEGWRQGLHPDDRDRIAAEWYQSAQENCPFQLEYRFQRPDGVVTWVYGQAVAERDEAGQVIGYVGTVTDISERQAALQERRQAERQLQNLIEGTAVTTGQNFFPTLVSNIAEALNVSSALVTEKVKDTLHVLAFWANGALQPTFSYHPAKTPWERTLQEGKFYCDSRSDPPWWNRFVQQQFPDDPRLAQMGIESYLGIALRNTYGQVIGSLCILSQQPIPDPQRAENLLRVFAARAAAELERERATRALEHLNQKLERKVKERTVALQISEERWQLALKGANDGIWDWDLRSNKIFFSDRWKEMRGFSRDEISDLPDEYLSRIHPYDYELVMAAVDDHFAGRTEFFEIEYRVRCKDGSYIWVLDRAKAQRDKSGQVVRISGSTTDITDRKQIEMALRESERRYATLATLAPVAIFRFDTSLNCTYVSDRWSEMTGRPLESALGRGWSDTLHPEDRDRLLAQWVEGYDQSPPGNQIFNRAEGRHLLPDGSINWFYVQSAKEIDANGRVVGSVGTLTDITERKQAELALQESEIRFRRVFESSVVGMIFADFQGQIIDANDHFLEMIGYTREELNAGAIHWDAMTPPEYISTDMAVIEHLRQYGFMTPWEKEYYRKDGSLVPVLMGAALLPGSNNQTICVVLDISDRKQTEIALRESEEKFRQLAEVVDAVFWMLNLDRTERVYVSPAYERIWGKRCIDLHITPDSWLDTIHPEDRDRVAAAIEKQLRGEYDEEYRIVRPDGEIRWIRDRAFLIQNDQGQAYRIAGIAEDITARKQYEAQLKQTNEELARATRLKDEFLANMSHELRTPLNAILGMTEGLQEKVFGEINERQIKALQIIERSGTHLLELINDILDVAKIESGQLELDCAPTAVAPLCQSSLTFIKQQALKKGIQLEIKLPVNLPDLLVDERRIRQVLINLLNNAVKFTPEGGRITLEVSRQRQTKALEPPPLQGITRVRIYRTTLEQELGLGLLVPTLSQKEGLLIKDYLRIAVTDTGIGIAPEYINKLFQPFVQIDSALNRQYTGTGLGLALVKRIVELHGGEVGLTSEVGVGSCFTIDLPYVTAAPFSPEAETQPDPSMDFSQPQQGASPLILLAEDNEANISTVSSYLEAKGYRLVLAKNGREAIALAQSEHPDLILMDIQMPEMDGLEAIQQLRQMPNLVNVPIIALTALAMTGDRDRCLAAGANDYLSKPVKLKQLVATIQQRLASQ